MGACTVTITDVSVFGNQEVRMGTIACSTSYAAGGDTWTAANFGLANVIALVVNPGVNGTPTGFLYIPDLTNKKLIALGDSGGAGGSAFAEASGDLHTFVANYIAFGK